MGYGRLWRRNLCGVSTVENAVKAGGMQGAGGRRLVTRTMLGGEQLGWGAVSGGKEVHGLAFVKRMVASNCPLFPHILCSDFIPNVSLDSLQDQNSTRTDCDKDMLTSGQLRKLRMIPTAIQSRSNRAPTAPTVPLLLA